jgi:hypothetical protein
MLSYVSWSDVRFLDYVGILPSEVYNTYYKEYVGTLIRLLLPCDERLENIEAAVLDVWMSLLLLPAVLPRD